MTRPNTYATWRCRALVDDPFPAEKLTAKDRQRLRLAKALGDDTHQSWRPVPETIRRNGQITYEVLSGFAG